MEEEDDLRLISRRKILLAILGVFIVVAGVLVAYFITSKNRSETNKSSANQSGNQNIATDQNDDGQLLSHSQCKGTEKSLLSELPMNLSDFSMILPYGFVIGAHVTPIDHQYFSPASMNSPRDAYPVYAMTDAVLVSVEPRVKPEGTEYRMIFSVSCKLFYYYDLVTSLSDEIQTAYDSTGGRLNLPVTAGQQIGRIGGQTLDFAVWDMDSYLKGYIHPELYKVETWKIHTVDPLLYYTDELKAKILAKYIRSVEPRSGKIDYDIAGKLQGNWFLEGTNGYAGLERSSYWDGHLSITPDYIDPTSIVVSMGDYAGEAKQFGVKGNAPDPIAVGVESGLVKYELVQQDWSDANGRQWDRTSLRSGLRAQNQNTVEGVVLLQVLEGEKLKFEAFPGKTAAEVSAFTSNAKIYER